MAGVESAPPPEVEEVAVGETVDGQTVIDESEA